MKTFTEDTATVFLQKLKGWEYKANGIEKKFQFKDFKQALGFIVR